MEYISVKETAKKFGISERRIQRLCEDSRITGAKRISSVWVIPANAIKPDDNRTIPSLENKNLLSLNEVCKRLSISIASGRNWLKLNKLKTTKIISQKPYFSKDYILNLEKELLNNDNTKLKTRRNKKFISGISLYNNYLSANSENIIVVENIVNQLSSNTYNEDLFKCILVECALQLFFQKYKIDSNIKSNILLNFIKGNYNENVIIKKYNKLFNDIIKDINDVTSIIEEYQKIFLSEFIYEENEDVLGLLYLSCKNIGDRKANGMYYTPSNIVNILIDNLIDKTNIDEKTTILDPCSGTGNFLLKLPKAFKIENIYANDIDVISIQLTRINLLLKFTNCDINVLYNNILVKDYLLDTNQKKYDYIIGNPPWGCEYNQQEKENFKKLFKCAIRNNIDSYDLFIEKSHYSLNNTGIISFVLPESLLNVKTHQPIRQLIIDNYNILCINYLGNAFDQVQCPAIIIKLNKTCKKINTIGMHIINNDVSFDINTERNIDSEYFSFTLSDTEYILLDKIFNNNNCIFLKNNADFALGIVTGDNSKYISNTKLDNNEIVLKGSDIYKFRFKKSNNYIIYEPENFQQVAPTMYYRSEEKLFYRFISNQLVFAYDNSKTLSLNSCNIVIPKIKNLKLKYIMAILNSRISQFIFMKKFQSIKVLRSHIEQIPIPNIDDSMQKTIVDYVNDIIICDNPDNITKIYNELDLKISEIFNLNKKEYEIIYNNFTKNLFLY